ncbi:GAP family protein [Streptomyces sp. NPDC059340]|uniref:GAP family protein n=1 Tax=Streptomyces sp. NPDC059340 TaxID=3346806 RepID=UPI0036BA9BAE
MLPSYNNRNAAGGGCLDEVDEGLTDYGRALIREMNAVGMVAGGSHCGARTGLDMCEVSEQPVIYSHSCMRSVWDHPRNISDEQAKECAATGGVIGITGVGIFLGPNDATIDALVRHIDYAVDLVGPEHVGVSTDYPFDHEDFNAMLEQSPELFPDCYTRCGPINFMPPESLLTVEDALLPGDTPTTPSPRSWAATSAASPRWCGSSLGVLLVLFGARQWHRRPKDPSQAQLPKWMGAIDRLTPVKVFGLGLALAALNAKNAPLTIAAAASIGSAGLPVGQEIASLAIFVLIATLGLLAPLGVYMLGGSERRPHSATGKTGQLSTTSP